MKIEIKNRWTQSAIYTCADALSFRDAVNKANALRISLRDADLRDADLIDADLRDADLIDADLRDADLIDADLRDADLRDADLSGANLSGADLSGADLIDADLRDADLIDADLRDADLRDADLSGANLSGADLSGADLRDADLRDADLIDADLSGANLSGADLIGANLSGADLRDADLRDADLRGADLRGAAAQIVAKHNALVGINPEAVPLLLEALELALKTSHIEGQPFRHWHAKAQEALEKAKLSTTAQLQSFDASLNTAAGLRAACLRELATANLTADEIATRLGIKPCAIRPRMAELHTRCLIIETGEKRPSVNGSPMTVWKAL